MLKQPGKMDPTKVSLRLIRRMGNSQATLVLWVLACVMSMVLLFLAECMGSEPVSSSHLTLLLMALLECGADLRLSDERKLSRILLRRFLNRPFIVSPYEIRFSINTFRLCSCEFFVKFHTRYYFESLPCRCPQSEPREHRRQTLRQFNEFI